MGSGSVFAFYSEERASTIQRTSRDSYMEKQMIPALSANAVLSRSRPQRHVLSTIGEVHLLIGPEGVPASSELTVG